MTKRYALAADMGGTLTRVALVDGAGNMTRRRSEQTLERDGRDAVMGRLLEALRRTAEGVDPGELAGVGLSIASPTDPATGEMHNPPNLRGEEWHLFSPKRYLEGLLGLPVRAANDATLGALGEHAFGAGRGCRNMVYMTVSTGIGGGIVIEGRLYTGVGGFAGEIGHFTIDRNGPVCNCGNVGCLEALASGTALARQARERLEAGEQSALTGMANGDLANVDARMVAEAARAGDGLAAELMRDMGRNLGIGIVSLMHIFDPDLIVMGGGVSQSLDLLLPEIGAQIRGRGMAHARGRMPVARSELGDDVSLLGAAAFVFAEAGG